MCVALFHFNVPLLPGNRNNGTCHRSQSLSFRTVFFFSCAVVTIFDLVLSLPVEISPGGDASLRADSIVVFCQSLMLSAFQESLRDEILVFEHESYLLLIIQFLIAAHTLVSWSCCRKTRISDSSLMDILYQLFLSFFFFMNIWKWRQIWLTRPPGPSPHLCLKLAI